ncbi:thioesterase family protein [Mycobacterium yunnanensis]|uniref:Thioesterase family protein n=1 Tax=Mycobacterium yunnanensis TaxID=368477 RepID=A0A9X2Z0C6_9MYCO|nr:thioesterase family protein [Mycobacterium yunnanensis]MCV7421214.1 thioesterase family protein [Mycobacterium yunnanensis]
MDGSTSFGDAMRLSEVSSDDPLVRVFDGELNEHWTIGPKVHGGAMLALCANAARTVITGGQERSDRGSVTGGQDVEPIAVSGSFLWAPDPGPVRVITTTRKRGRRISVVDVALKQGDERSREEQRTAVRTTITLAVPEHDAPPLLSVNPVAQLMTPDPPPGLEPIGPGHPMADVVHLAHGCDIRPSMTTMQPRTDESDRSPAFQYWVRPKDASPDVLFALLSGDLSAPVTLGLNRSGWAPTVQLTAYLRARPADGWLRVMCTATQIGQEWFDEDHVVVDCEGRIVVQSRQLALVPPPA